MSTTPNAITPPVYRQLAVFSAVVGLVLGILQYLGKLGMYPSFAWVCYVFFTFLSFLIIGLIAMSNQSSTPGRAVYIVLGAMGLKFLFSILMVLTYILAVQPTKVHFIIPFFFLYIVYTSVETYFLMKVVNKKT